MCINICTIQFFFVPLHDFYVIKMKKSFIFAVIIGIAGMLSACSTSVQKAQKEVTAGTVSLDTINGIPCRGARLDRERPVSSYHGLPTPSWFRTRDGGYYAGQLSEQTYSRGRAEQRYVRFLGGTVPYLHGSIREPLPYFLETGDARDSRFVHGRIPYHARFVRSGRAVRICGFILAGDNPKFVRTEFGSRTLVGHRHRGFSIQRCPDLSPPARAATHRIHLFREYRWSRMAELARIPRAFLAQTV